MTQTLLTGTPSNINFLPKTGFTFAFKRTPNIRFYCQKANLPGFSVDPTHEGSPFVSIPLYGDHVDFEELRLNFIVDEDMANYMEIWNWLIALGWPRSYADFAQLAMNPEYTGLGPVADCSLLILDAKKNPNWEVAFTDAFPIALGNIDFDTRDEYGYATVDVTFRYRDYKMIRAKAGYTSITDDGSSL